MRSRHLHDRRLAGILTFLLAAGCGGPGMNREETGRPHRLEGAAAGGPAPVVDPVESAAERAARDLGLVDADLGVRIVAASGESGRLTVDQFTVAMLDTSATVRREAVEGLSSRHGTLPLAALEAALGDPDVSVREAVVELAAAADDRRAARLLRLALEDPEPLVREEAAEALYRWRRRRAAAAGSRAD